MWTKEETKEYQDAARSQLSEFADEHFGPLTMKGMRWPGECEQCGRPNNGGYQGICDRCRLGPI
jgi:hypothetical protein